MNRISQRQLDRLTPQVRPLLAQLAVAARSAGAESITLVSGLAEGADRHVALLALDEGYELHALLPFVRDVYVGDFPGSGSRAAFDDLLARADRVTELPGRPGFSAQAYHRAGEALLDQCDLLLAVWDGQPAQGPGGTAEVIESACQRRMPVLHVSSRHREAPMLLWRRQGQAARGRAASEAVPARRCGPSQVSAMVSRLLRAG